mmetsp:Transcript_62037/g.121833  ORF Transcript_62037/g.121833 Transcript_62037/m.121833 type:complete len:310 (+) Transcript_62037:595-1524(+)
MACAEGHHVFEEGFAREARRLELEGRQAMGHRQLRSERCRHFWGHVAPRIFRWHATVQMVRIVLSRRDTQAQLLHVCVEHVRLKEELMQAPGSVLAPVALHDGHDRALLSGFHGVPESWQEGVDVAGVRVQLETFATLKKVANLAKPPRKRPPSRGVQVDLSSGFNPHFRMLDPFSYCHEPHSHEPPLVDHAPCHRGRLAQHGGPIAQNHLVLLGGVPVVHLAHLARITLFPRLYDSVPPVDGQGLWVHEVGPEAVQDFSHPPQRMILDDGHGPNALGTVFCHLEPRRFGHEGRRCRDDARARGCAVTS